MVIVLSRYSSPYNRWMKFPHWNQTIIVGHRRAVFTWLRVTLKRVKLIRYLFYCYTIGKSSGRPVGNPIKTNLQQQRWSWCDSVSSWTWRGAFLRQPNNFEIISCLWKKTLAKQSHFHSGSSSTLRFSPKIATEQIANQNASLLTGYSSPFFMRV